MKDTQGSWSAQVSGIPAQDSLQPAVVEDNGQRHLLSHLEKL